MRLICNYNEHVQLYENTFVKKGINKLRVGVNNMHVSNPTGPLCPNINFYIGLSIKNKTKQKKKTVKTIHSSRSNTVHKIVDHMFK